MMPSGINGGLRFANPPYGLCWAEGSCTTRALSAPREYEGVFGIEQRHSGAMRSIEPQMCNCASGNLEIPGLVLRTIPEWLELRRARHRAVDRERLFTQAASVAAIIGFGAVPAPGFIRKS
jgi:hypothetical protein